MALIIHNAGDADMPGLHFKMYSKPYEETPLVRSARLFATWAHDGQKRKTGGPYILHPARVAAQVVDWDGDVEMVAAAWLHDVVEDCMVEHRTIRLHFGDRVGALVHGLTDQYIPAYYPKLNRQARKTLEAKRLAAEGPDVRLIKRADIADNLRDISKFDSGFQVLFGREKEYLLKLFDVADYLDGVVASIGRAPHEN
jgi:(p)ppGpp synthase/HD superfamily hydrolase